MYYLKKGFEQKKPKSLKSEIGEHGGVLVFLALFSVTLMLIIGLVIDTGVLATSKTSHEHTADMVALAAMDEFTKKDSPSTLRERLEAAAVRASEIGNMNFDVWVAKDLLSNAGRANSNYGNVVSGPGRVAGPNGSIIAGHWFFEQPDAATCAASALPHGTLPSPDCRPCASWSGACFARVNISSPDAQVNSLRLSINTHRANARRGASGVEQSGFSQVDGTHNPLQLVSAATVAIVPRHILVAVDLSPSIAAETHGRNELPSGKFDPETAGLYAFQVAVTDDAGNLAPGTPFASNADLGSYTYRLGDPITTFNGNQAAEFACLQETWQNSGNSHPFPVTPAIYCESWYDSEPKRKQQDYRPFKITSGDSPAEFDDLTFYVDTENDPEPLRSVLSGVNSALNVFKDRSVGADKIGFIGFDDDILAIRSTKHPSTGEPALISSLDPDFQEILDATTYSRPVPDSANPGHVTAPHLERFLFPRMVSGRSFTNGVGAPFYNTQSDLPTVMARAVSNIFAKADNAANAQGIFIMITDGMPTCPFPNSPGVPVVGQTMPTNNAPTVCSTEDYRYNLGAIESMVGYARDELRPSNISFNLFLIGEDSAPHTMVMGNSEGGCMSDEEHRALAPINGNNGPRQTFVNSEQFLRNRYWSSIHGPTLQRYSQRNSGNPWYAANHLYKATRYSAGSWVPIRPACAAADMEAQLKTACSGLAEFQPLTGPFGPPVASGARQIYASSVDRNGRLLCDPGQRSTQKQVADELEKLVSQNPFLLVSEE